MWERKIVIMKYNYFLLLVGLLCTVAVQGQVNPYPDGTSLSDPTTVNQNWSVASGTIVTAEADFNSQANGIVRGDFTVNGNYVNTGWAGDDIEAGATLEIFRNLYSYEKIRVLEGGTIIVHGDYIDYGGSASYIHGTMVVVGSVDLSGVNIYGNGKLVVGGDVTIRDSGGDYSGDIYAVNPDRDISIPNHIGDVVGDIDDFLSNESGNSDLNNLVKDVGLVSNVDAPTGFTFTSLSGTDVDLQWLLNTIEDSVMIAWSESDLSDRPATGSNYEVGATLSMGSEVIYKGKSEAWTYTGLTPGVTAYLQIWSFSSPDNEFSRAVKLEVKPLSSETIFYDGFEGSQKPEWSLSSNGSGNNNWIVGSETKYMGDNAIYISNDAGTNVSYKKVNVSTTTMTLSLSGIAAKYKSVELSFYWKCMGEENADAGFVVETDWSAQYAGQNTWVEKVIDITELISGGSVSIPFSFVTNNSGGVDPGFCIDEVRVIGSEVAKPGSFSGTANSTSEVALQWFPSDNEPVVLIAYSPYGSIGRPESGKYYSAGDYLPGGGQVVYVGSATNTLHIGNFQGKLTYNIWSVTGGEYSSALSTEVNIPVELPYFEDFETNVDEWTFGVGYNSWYNGSATAYNSSSKSAYISYDRGFTAGFDVGSTSSSFMDVTVDLRGYETASLSFYWQANGSSNNYGEVYLDNNKLTSTEGRSSFYSSTSWKEEVFSLDSYTDGIHTLRFRWYNTKGGTAHNPGFCIDDVRLFGTIAAPANFTATNPNDLLNNLNWEQNALGDEVLVAWSADGTFGEPEPGKIYKAGDAIPDGGTVLFLGDLLSYEHAPLNYGTIYYYKAWSHRNGIYSTGIEKNANTPAKVVVLSENWDDTPVPAGLNWTSTTNTANSWVTDKSALVDGNTTNFAFISSNGTSAQYQSITWPKTVAYLDVTVNLDELLSANLTFDWIAKGNSKDYGEVYLNGEPIGGTYSGQTTWQSASISLNDYCSKNLNDITLRFAWYSVNWEANNPGFCIDNIEIGGIYDPTSKVSSGVREAESVASIINTQTDAVSVFSFDLTDDVSKYNDITRIQQLVVSKGTNNGIANWNDVIAGALLVGPDQAGLEGVVSSGSITFTDADMLLLETEGIAETYTLKIWLKTDLNGNGIIDGDAFDFAVSGEDIVTGLGDDFIKASRVESGPIEIEVVATELLFTQQPSQFGTFGYPLAISPQVSAVDANGNIDTDFTGEIAIINSEALTMSPLTATSTLGTATFTGLQLEGSGSAIVTLEASSSSLNGSISGEIQLADYCIPSSSDNSSYIQQVLINTINNTTGQDASAYAQYLDMETSLLIGSSYDINIAVYNSADGNKALTRYANIWVDWDGNGIFDSDEMQPMGSTNVKDDFETINSSIIIPADQDAIVGVHRMRVQFTSHASNACSGTSGESEDYTVVLASDGWQGQNNLWNLPANWSSGVVPDGATDVYIPTIPYLGTAFPVIDGEASMNNLEVASGASLNVLPGSSVTINGDIINNGTILIENNNAQPTSVITNVNMSITGDMSFKWNYDNAHWWFIGHPIANPTIDNYQALRVAPQDNDYLLYDFQDGTNFVKVSDLTEVDYRLADQNELRGYQFKVLNSGAEVVHTGLVNNQASYAQGVVSAGKWQILANPYPSYYQLPVEGVSGADFEHTTGSVYISESVSNVDKKFYTFNTLTGIATPSDYNGSFDGLIAPNQAFYVKSAEGASVGDAVTIRASHRVHDLNSTKTPLKSAKKTEEDILRIHVTNGAGTDEAVIAFRDFGENALTRYDSEKLFASGSGLSFIYSLKDDVNTVINVLPEGITEASIQLGVKAQKGQHRISIKGIESLSRDYEVVLEDKSTQPSMLIPVGSTTVYEFTAEEEVDNDRFVLRLKEYKAEVPTDIGAVDEVGNGVSIYVKDHSTLCVDCNWNINEKLVKVYNVSGALVWYKAFNGERMTTELVLQPGLYIVRVAGENHTSERKVVIN